MVNIKMVNFCAVCGCCTRTDIVREHLEDTLRICDVSAMGLFRVRAGQEELNSRIFKDFNPLSCRASPLTSKIVWR
jgi:hypothetical protein